MESASLAIGVFGLIAVFDKACEVWHAIGSAQDFGEDVDSSMRKLQIEFFRFHSWWIAAEKLGLRSQSIGNNSAYSSVPLAIHLSGSAQNPIITAAQSILSALVEIERVLRDSGALEVLRSHERENSAKRQRTSGTPGMLRSAESQVMEAASASSQLSQRLMLAIPWRKRVKHDAAPWRESHKKCLDNKTQEISYWNQVLYSVLPSDLKDSILWQGISSYVLADPEEVVPISQLGEGVMSQQAKLFEAHRKLAENGTLDPVGPEVLRQRLINLEAFDMSGASDQEAFSLVSYKNNQGNSVLIEWYDLPLSTGANVELRSIALERLARLSLLLSQENKPSTLCTVDSIGCISTGHLHRLGLVSRVPDGFSTSTQPVLLYSLLNRKPLLGTSSRAPLPTLSQRFTLTATLASSLYTFILARWHHKMFNSLNIMFMFPSAGARVSLPDLSRPLVCGYSLSRPSAPEEISICGMQTSVSETYLHPQLRVLAHERPRYEIKYDIYSFGLLLAEIGFWQPIAKIGATNSPRHGVSAESFKAGVTSKCASDLACWMGERYRDITIRCLQVGDPDASNSVEDLTGFYWNVVLELVRCAERVKAFESA